MPLYRNFRGICEMYGDCNDADPIPNFLSLCGMLSDSDEPTPTPTGFEGVREMALELCEENNPPFFTEIVLPDNLRIKGQNDRVFTLTYAQLLANSDAADEEGDPITFGFFNYGDAMNVEIDGEELSEANWTIGPGQVLAFEMPDAPGPKTAMLLQARDSEDGDWSGVDVQLNVDIAMVVTGGVTTLTGLDHVTFLEGEEDEEQQAWPATPLVFGPYDNNEWDVESVNLYDSEDTLMENVILSPTGVLPYSTYLYVYLEVAG